MKTLWLDLETYSEVPITNGTHAYAEGHRTPARVIDRIGLISGIRPGTVHHHWVIRWHIHDLWIGRHDDDI